MSVFGNAMKSKCPKCLERDCICGKQGRRATTVASETKRLAGNIRRLALVEVKVEVEKLRKKFDGKTDDFSWGSFKSYNTVIAFIDKEMSK